MAKNSVVWSPQVWLCWESCTPTMPSAASRLGLPLHPLHRKLAGVVQSLSERWQFGVRTRVSEHVAERSVRDVVVARAHHYAERHVPGLQQRPEVLPGQVRGERLAAVVAPAAATLGDVRALLLQLDSQPHGDDAVGAEYVCLRMDPAVASVS
jgi:hypothetical protein